MSVVTKDSAVPAPTSKATRTVALPGTADSKDLELAALSALYQADKSDASSIFNVSMAMMGIGAAYIIGAVGYSDQFGQGELAWPVVLLSAFPLWLIAAFHSLLALNGMAHGVSVQILEDAIYEKTGLADGKRGYVGSRTGDSIMDVTVSQPAHAAASVFVYFGVALLVLGYTIYVLITSWAHVPPWLGVGSLLIYLLGAGVVGLSWATGFGYLARAQESGEVNRGLARRKWPLGRRIHVTP